MVLYEQFAFATAEHRRLLCKPIIVFIATITEALLHDFQVRCTRSVWEKIENAFNRLLRSYVDCEQVRPTTVNGVHRSVQSGFDACPSILCKTVNIHTTLAKR
jgi:hypothetical protein